MKRALVIAALVWWLLLALLLQTSIKDWLWMHPWWHAFLVTLPGIVTAGVALLELRHSGEANELRRQNNELRETLDSERNQHLQDIAKHTKPQPTAAERMAAKLRGCIGRSATVSEGKSVWGSSIQIAEVSDECIATLFSPAGYSSTQAWAVNVHCNDLELVDIGGQLKLRVNKRYGDTMDLGNLKRVQQVEIEAEGFTHSQSGNTGSQYRLYVKTH